MNFFQGNSYKHMYQTLCWIVGAGRTQSGAVGPDWTVSPGITDLASGAICWCGCCSSRYTHIATMTVARGHR